MPEDEANMALKLWKCIIVYRVQINITANGFFCQKETHPSLLCTVHTLYKLLVVQHIVEADRHIRFERNA